MNREDIIKLAREAGAVFDHMTWVERDLAPVFERFAALVAATEREILADWMRQHGFSTGQAYTTEILLDRLGTETVENTDAAVLEEREECAKVCEAMRPSKPEFDQRYYQGCTDSAAAIRARGNT